MANIITSSRVLFSLILLFTKAFSTSFYVLYIMAGITDVLDGIVARKFKLESEFGEKLDTVADICFVGATLYKLLPVLKMPIWLWLWICVIVLLKLANIISGFWRQNTSCPRRSSKNVGTWRYREKSARFWWTAARGEIRVPFPKSSNSFKNVLKSVSF